MKKFTGVISLVTFIVLSLWILGLLFTDRWAWSQWLSWIPTLPLLMLILITASSAIFEKTKMKATVFCFIFVFVFCWYLFIENRFNATGRNGALRIVGWTMSYSKQKVSKESAEEVIRLNGDITLLTHGWIVRGEPIIKEWLGEGKRRVSGPFTLLTRLPVLEVNVLVASDGIYISMFRIDTSEQLGKPLVLWAIDLPSNITIPKIETARRVRRLLSSIEVPRPDIIIGDFNMTRDSFSIVTMFPEFIDASNLAGTGLLASFPMQIPLYHIDHSLVGDSFVCDSYVLINPHIGRHRVQIVEMSAQKND